MLSNTPEYYEKLSRLPEEIQRFLLEHKIICGIASRKDRQMLSELGGFRRELWDRILSEEDQETAGE